MKWDWDITIERYNICNSDDNKHKNHYSIISEKQIMLL